MLASDQIAKESALNRTAVGLIRIHRGDSTASESVSAEMGTWRQQLVENLSTRRLADDEHPILRG